MDGEPDRVLVVDDEEVILLSVGRILEKDAIRLDFARSADEAAALLQSNTYPVVISDIKMPGMDGLALLELIQRTARETRVIMITGYATMSTALKALRLGAFDFIAKPFTREELRNVVIRALRDTVPNVADQSSRDHGEKSIVAGKIFVLPHHSWGKVLEDGNALVGLEASFFEGTDRPVRIELPGPGDMVDQGGTCGRIILQNDQVRHAISPFSGRIVIVNQEIISDPSLAATDSRARGWLMIIEPTKIEFEVENLVVGG
jgi:CheY-like chemotaxis protein/glycine cleavage system H lipoate-binding protein